MRGSTTFSIGLGTAGGTMGFTTHRMFDGKGSRAAEVRKTLWLVLVLNVVVAAAKLGWGIVIGSVSMVADGFHSMFDGTSNVVGLIGMSAAGRPADRSHPYGHGKYETIASAAIGAMLALAAWRVGAAAIERLMHPGPAPNVGLGAFAVMIGTLAVNVFVTRYEARRGRDLRSAILTADARHTSSDVLVSLGVIAGLGAVRLGFPLADPIIALLVAGAIAWTAWGVFRQVNATLSDSSVFAPSILRAAAMEIDGVLGAHNVRTRGSEAEVYVDMHVQVDPSSTIRAAHAVAEAVERALCEHFSEVVDVIVHVEPMDDYQQRKTIDEIESGLA